MIRAVLLYLTGNTSATASITNFATEKAAIDTKMILIGQLEPIAQGNSKGVTLDTKALRVTMTKLALKCANPLVTFASRSNPVNNTLMNKVNIPKSTFPRYSKEEVAVVCQTIQTEANANIAGAGGFGYNAADVSDLQTAINLYLDSMPSTRQAIITKSDAIEQIESITRNIIDIGFKLGLDRMVNTLEDSNPSFYNTYYKSREIINLGTTHAKIRGTVRNPQDTLLLGVRVWLTKTGLTEVIQETLTDIKGKFSLTNIQVDDYDVHYEFQGYQNKLEANLHVPAGKEFVRKVKLDYISYFTGIIPGNSSANILNPSTPVWRPGATFTLRNNTPIITPTTLNAYTPNTPNDPGPGNQDIQLNNGQDYHHTITVAEFKPYFNFANTSPNPATYEIIFQ